MGKERVSVMVCDNPECGEQFFTSDNDPAPGYYLGKGQWVLAGGGPIPATYAHDVECIVPAIQANMEG